MRLASIPLMAILAACGGDDDGGGGDGDGDGDGDRNGERGPIAVADLSGSCADTECDGPAPEGNCWCDEDCTHHADCCDDYVHACAGDRRTCGGFIGDACERPTFCRYAPSDMCGTGDQIGTCFRVPDSCTDEVAAVCGCDGQNYDNACLAAMVGTSVLSDGPCR